MRMFSPHFLLIFPGSCQIVPDLSLSRSSACRRRLWTNKQTKTSQMHPTTFGKRQVDMGGASDLSVRSFICVALLLRSSFTHALTHGHGPLSTKQGRTSRRGRRSRSRGRMERILTTGAARRSRWRWSHGCWWWRKYNKSHLPSRCTICVVANTIQARAWEHLYMLLENWALQADQVVNRKRQPPKRIPKKTHFVILESNSFKFDYIYEEKQYQSLYFHCPWKLRLRIHIIQTF
jgi:hypothetical protein